MWFLAESLQESRDIFFLTLWLLIYEWILRETQRMFQFHFHYDEPHQDDVNDFIAEPSLLKTDFRSRRQPALLKRRVGNW